MAAGNPERKNTAISAYSQEKSYDMMGRHREIGKWMSILEMIRSFFRRIFNLGGGRGPSREHERKMVEEMQRAQKEREDARLREEGRRQAYVDQKRESIERAAAMQNARAQGDTDTPKFLRNASLSTTASTDMRDRIASIRKKSEDSSPAADDAGYTKTSAIGHIEAARKVDDEQTPQEVCGSSTTFPVYNIDAFVAARHGDTETLREMIENPERYKDFSIHQTNEQGYNLLHVACKHGSLNCIKMLLETDCDVAARNNKGESPLDLAATDEIRSIIARRAEEQEEQGMRPFS